MRGTRLDGVVAVAVLLFVLFILSMLIGPVRVLSQERDEVRTADVRELMNNLLQLQIVDPEAYSTLVADVRAENGLRMILGDGDCATPHGSQCGAEVTADSCLSINNYFPELLLDHAPIDPRGEPFSANLTGYYFAVVDNQFEVGACGVYGEPITLHSALTP